MGKNATILYHFFYFATKAVLDYFNKNNMSMRKYFFPLTVISLEEKL